MSFKVDKMTEITVSAWVAELLASTNESNSPKLALDNMLSSSPNPRARDNVFQDWASKHLKSDRSQNVGISAAYEHYCRYSQVLRMSRTRFAELLISTGRLEDGASIIEGYKIVDSDTFRPLVEGIE